MKGIVLAGGAGSRLYPLTLVASKQLQAVYDKPMVHYPLATLLQAGIRDILLITTAEDLPRFRQLLGDGSQWGVLITYATQDAPRGIAEALIIAEPFLDGDPVTLILGDNLFYGDMGLREAMDQLDTGALIYGYPVVDPERYGIVELDDDGAVLSLEEKPVKPRSNLAVPGVYAYDSRAPEVARSLTPSARGELEITDVNRWYAERGELRCVRLGRGVAWLDSGTPDSLLESSQLIATIEKRQGLKIACLEEIALQMGFLTHAELARTVDAMPRSAYKDYVEQVLTER